MEPVAFVNVPFIGGVPQFIETVRLGFPNNYNFNQITEHVEYNSLDRILLTLKEEKTEQLLRFLKSSGLIITMNLPEKLAIEMVLPGFCCREFNSFFGFRYAPANSERQGYILEVENLIRSNVFEARLWKTVSGVFGKVDDAFYPEDLIPNEKSIRMDYHHGFEGATPLSSSNTSGSSSGSTVSTRLMLKEFKISMSSSDSGTETSDMFNTFSSNEPIDELKQPTDEDVHEIVNDCVAELVYKAVQLEDVMTPSSHGSGQEDAGPFKQKERNAGISCTLCPEQFSTFRSLAAHKLLKHTVIHLCSICKQIFPSKLALSSHLIRHTIKGDPNQETISELEVLKKPTESRNTRTKIQCPHCHISIVSERKFQAHIKSHKTTNPSHKCKFCI